MMVDGYREEVERLRTVAEEATGGYEQETKDWFRDHPLPKFKDWLVGNRRTDVGVNEAVADWEAAGRPMPVIDVADPVYDEQQVLGIAMACRTDNGLEMDGLAQLDPREFIAHPVHRHIAQAIQDLASYGRSYDVNAVSKLMTIRGQLNDPQVRGQLPIDHAGGHIPAQSPARYLQQLHDDAGIAAWGFSHAEAIRTRTAGRAYTAVTAQAAQAAPGAVLEGRWPENLVTDHAAALSERLRKLPQPLGVEC
jgi:hypothetical protein